ncbi:TfuA-like protein [Mycobacterium heidelbergense]|uniref:TfuA-like protein n=1 Tax=Mycobacterium heidelbergense TaxID=53376 RepID=UPI003CFA8BCC
MSGVVVFIGPTLPLAEAQRVLPGAEFVGPAQRGDIARAVLDRQPAAIVLIDGLFNTVPAVVHKEILFALSSGVRVVGAASMGALRAAELWTYGMEGIGEIFRRFQSGAWESDDEVAVIHGPAESGFRSASVALANIRLGLEQACERKLLAPDQAAGIVEKLRAAFYPERSWQAAFAIARNLGMSEQEIGGLKAFVAAEAPDAKRDDALEALSSVGAWRESDANGMAESAAVTFDFEPTIYWRKLLGEIHTAAPLACDRGNGDTRVDYPALVRDIRVQPDAREFHRGAALLHLLLAHARENMPPLTPEQLQLAVDRFRRRRGLRTADQALKFYREQQLTGSEIEVLARTEVALDTLLAQRTGNLAGLLALELKQRGEFAATFERVSTKHRLLQERAVHSLALEDLGVTLGELLDWYQDRFETIEGSLDSHAEALGYQSAREFISEVMLEYHLRTQAAPTPQSGR